MSKYIYNTTIEDIIHLGKSFPAEDYREIPPTMESMFANSSLVLTDIATGTIILSKTNDESGHISDVSAAINYLKDDQPRDVIVSGNLIGQLPFASKVLPDGRKIYRRVHGVSGSVQNLPDNIDFVVPYANCKILGVQILNGKIGDKANFKVLDTSTGLITGVPYFPLNQFGFNVNIVPEVATYPSKYDADLIAGLVLRIEYDAIDELLPRTIYINLDLHEIKD